MVYLFPCVCFQRTRHFKELRYKYHVPEEPWMKKAAFDFLQ